MRRKGTRRALVAASAAFCFVSISLGCASTPTAGTGDVAFRLLWKGESDLDLHVVDPRGEHLSYGHRSAGSGGRLDVDCNAGTGRLCDQPIENVFWPEGAAPDGRYRFWVQGHSIIPAEAPVEARLLVLEGTRVLEERRATFRENGDRLGPFALEYARAVGPGEVVAVDDVGEDEEPLAYRCDDGFAFGLAMGIDRARVVVDGRSILLDPFHGFGATHASPDGSTRLDWPEGGGALLIQGGTVHGGCRPVGSSS